MTKWNSNEIQGESIAGLLACKMREKCKCGTSYLIYCYFFVSQTFSVMFHKNVSKRWEIEQNGDSNSDCWHWHCRTRAHCSAWSFWLTRGYPKVNIDLFIESHSINKSNSNIFPYLQSWCTDQEFECTQTRSYDLFFVFFFNKKVFPLKNVYYSFAFSLFFSSTFHLDSNFSTNWFKPRHTRFDGETLVLKHFYCFA